MTQTSDEETEQYIEELEHDLEIAINALNKIIEGRYYDCEYTKPMYKQQMQRVAKNAINKIHE